MTLGERIKKYRQEVGLSQEQLAEKINVSRQAITKWENDISDIKLSAINQRNRNCTLYLVAVICSLITWFSWFIALILSAAEGNIALVALSDVNILLFSFLIGFCGRRYFYAKKSQ